MALVLTGFRPAREPSAEDTSVSCLCIGEKVGSTRTQFLARPELHLLCPARSIQSPLCVGKEEFPPAIVGPVAVVAQDVDIE